MFDQCIETFESGRRSRPLITVDLIRVVLQFSLFNQSMPAVLNFVEQDLNELPESTRLLFPLRLTSMERFHLYDEDAANPNNFFWSFRFVGELDRQSLKQALHFAARTHPLFHSVIKQTGSRFQWQIVDQVNILHDISQSDGSARIPTIDINHESGCRCYITKSLESSLNGIQTELLFQFHHCTCDGAGGFQFVATVFHAYDNLVAGRNIESGIRLPDVQLLKSRGNLGLASRRYLQNVWNMRHGLFGAFKFIFRKHAGLVQQPHSQPWDGSLPMFIGDWLSADELTHWRQKADQMGVTLNTILMSQLFLSLHQWNLRHQSEAVSQFIRIVLTMNIRTVSDRWLPATNRSAVVQVDRRADEFDDMSSFLKELDREVDVIRRWQLDKIFLIAVRVMSIVPAWLRSSARNQKCRGAAIWTNLGRPMEKPKSLNSGGKFKAGDLELTELDIAGPVRQLTPVNFCVAEHHKRLRFSIYFDPRQFSVESANELFAIWANRIRPSE